MKVLDFVFTLAAGLLFGFGLAWSTMIRPEAILAFLNLQDMGCCWCWGAQLASICW